MVQKLRLGGVWLILGGGSEILRKNSGGGSEILRKNSRGGSQISRDIQHQVICTKVLKNHQNDRETTISCYFGFSLALSSLHNGMRWSIVGSN